MSGHGHAVSSPGRLRIALVATACVAVVECIGGIMSHSLALLSDSAHVFLDVVALAIALGAMHLASRPATRRQTFGFARTEILAALLNGGLLFAITVLIAIAAISRLRHPEEPQGALMAAVATIGLFVNGALGFALVRESHQNLNVRAAFLHIAGDALAALAVAIGGVLIWRFGWVWLDPALSLVVAAIIVVGVVNIVRESADVLLESAPSHADPEGVAQRIRAIDGVTGVHDLHVWTIGTASYALTGHVLLADRRISDATAILRAINDAMHDDYGVGHVTIQFECESCADDDRIVCTQLHAG